jgi:hypothetical protein
MNLAATASHASRQGETTAAGNPAASRQNIQDLSMCAATRQYGLAGAKGRKKA